MTNKYDVCVKSYLSDPTDPTKYNMVLTPADENYVYLIDDGLTFACTVGTYDPSTFTFPTRAIAQSYLIGFASPDLIQAIDTYNGIIPSTSALGNVFAFYDNHLLNTQITQVYRGMTGAAVMRSIPVEYTATKAVAGGAGQIIVYLTDDGTSTGNALFPNNIDFVKAEISDSSKGYNYDYAVSNSNRTLTITAKYFAPVTILGISVLLATTTAAANGTNVNILVKGN